MSLHDFDLAAHLSTKSARGFIAEELQVPVARLAFTALHPRLKRSKVALYLRGSEYGPCEPRETSAARKEEALMIGRLVVDYLETDEGRKRVDSILAEVDVLLAPLAANALPPSQYPPLPVLAGHRC